MWNLADFLSMHGIGHAIATKAKTLKIFWYSIVIACISLAIYFLYQLFTDYYKYETDWTVTEVVGNSIAFPVVTICNGLRRYFLNQTNVSLFTDGFVEYTKKSKDFCFFNLQSCSLSGMSFAPKYHEPSCVVFNQNESLDQELPFLSAGLETVFFINRSDTSVQNKGPKEYIPRMDAVRVYLHSKEVYLDLHNSHVTAKLGFFTTIVIKKVKIVREKAPYPSNCTNDELKQLNFYPGNYTQQGCFDTAWSKVSYPKCGHVYDAMEPYFPKENYRKVEFNKTCLDNLVLKQGYKYDVCPLPCHEVKFDIKVQTETKWPLENDLTAFRKMVSNMIESNVTDEYIYSNFGKVLIAYDTFDVVEYQEKPKYSTQKMLSDFGGLIGIYLGASLISMIEIFIVCGCLVMNVFTKGKKVEIAAEVDQ